MTLVVCKKGKSYMTCPKWKRNKYGCVKCRDASHREPGRVRGYKG